MSILVTGGAGYIGSHTVRQLVDAGNEVVVLDSMELGYEQAVIGADIVVGDSVAEIERQLAKVAEAIAAEIDFVLN